jgi:outer membrane protein assembly factor BamB
MSEQKTVLPDEFTVPRRLSMKRNHTHFLQAVLLFFFTLALLNVQAQDGWKQFRGAERSGVLTDIQLPDVLPENGPELLWTKDIGNGFPEVAVDRGVAYIFSSDSVDRGYEYLAAIAIESGEELWKTKLDSMWVEADGWGHGPRATPVIADDMIFCITGYGKFNALKTKSGKIDWTIDLPAEFGAAIPRWGFTSSPMLVDDLLILETGGTEGRAFTAFHLKTGEIAWSKGNGGTTYNSPAIAEINGQTNIVFANDTMLTSFTPKGEELWAFRMPLRRPTAMPVFIPPNKFFVSSVSDVGGFIVEVNDNEPKEILTSTTMQNNWSSSCYKDGYLYGFSKAKLQCVSIDSMEMLWGKRGFGKGSLIMLGDKLVIMSDQGKIIIVEATPDEYREVGSFQSLEGKSWTAPSYADGKLFVRNLSKMACYKLSK